MHRRPITILIHDSSLPACVRKLENLVDGELARKAVSMDRRNSRVESVDSGRFPAVDGKNNMVIEQIMLRFRPIAPRPATAQSSGDVFPAKDLNRKRVKRKYVRVKKTEKAINDSNDSENWFDLDRTVAMIKESTGREIVITDPLPKVSNWISFDLPGNKRKSTMNMNNLFSSEPPEKFPSDLHGVDLATAVQRQNVVESWITVESVTGTCEDRMLLGFTDDEIWKNLERDSCPGFVSSSYDEVQWVNPAYRRMLNLNSDGESPETEVAVWLVIKVEKLTVVKYLPAFSCRVRIEYRSSEKKTRMTVPCDVCQMDSGGFAWRLDVKFALSLGPISD